MSPLITHHSSLVTRYSLWEYLLAFSCMGRYFCPSCHQRRVVSFARWVEQEVLEKVPHRQYVFTIPKCLRIYFKYNWELMGERQEQSEWRPTACGLPSLRRR